MRKAVTRFPCHPGRDAADVEALAKQFLLALRIDEPDILSDDDIARVVEKFKGFGPREKG